MVSIGFPNVVASGPQCLRKNLNASRRRPSELFELFPLERARHGNTTLITSVYLNRTKVLSCSLQVCELMLGVMQLQFIFKKCARRILGANTVPRRDGLLWVLLLLLLLLLTVGLFESRKGMRTFNRGGITPNQSRTYVVCWTG